VFWRTDQNAVLYQLAPAYLLRRFWLIEVGEDVAGLRVEVSEPELGSRVVAARAAEGLHYAFLALG
jgi:hypothetical protein